MTGKKGGISRREFGQIAVVGAAVAPLAAISARASATNSAPQAQAAATVNPPADLKPHPALTAEQAAKLDEALSRLAAQLGQLRKHTLPYGAEPAFVFRAEMPRHPPAAPAPSKG